jgi:hypothetical protein
MLLLSRRRLMMLASSSVAAFAFLNGGRSRAQIKPAAEATVFEMADFIKGAPNPDAAFAKALAAIAKSTSDASKAGKPVHIVFNLEKNATTGSSSRFRSKGSAPSSSTETGPGSSIPHWDRRC